MSSVQVRREVTVDDAERALSNELGPHYRVSIDSDSTIKIGRTGVIPAKLTISRRGDTTMFKISTTGLIISRIVQATSINPRVKRALENAYSDTPASSEGA